MRKKRRVSGFLRGLLLPCGTAAALVCFATAIGSLERGREREDLDQLGEVLRKSSVACYASEGVYPPDLEYLKERYGVQIDEKRYIVCYDRFAQNLMPDITVLEGTGL